MGALNAIFGKVGDFFDIFDLSFFVAGAVCLGALAFGNSQFRLVDVALLTDGYKLLLFVGCYVLGLCCFAVGRMLRPRRSELLMSEFRSLVERHGLVERYGRYLVEQPGSAFLLYNRFWAVMRQTAALQPSFALLRRYWSMAATYDGLTSAFTTWWGVWLWWCLDREAPQPLVLRLVPVALLPLVVLVCRREAGRLTRFQMEELVASIALFENTLHSGVTEPAPAVKPPT
jgi:hypothetical protein